MKQIVFSFAILALALTSCMKGQSVDLIIHNAQIHTMDDKLSVYEAVAIKDGKIVEVGAERQILNKYSADEYIDAGNKDVYPGFIDAHGHMMNYARLKLSVDLVGCKSYDEMLLRIEKYQSKHKRPFIVGRGWDQNLWGDEMPTNEKLNELFPDIPVCLFRIDGHALLANDYLIKKSKVFEKFNADPEISQGGYYEMKRPHDGLDSSGKLNLKEHYMMRPPMGRKLELELEPAPVPSGVFVDNAMNPIIDCLPDFPQKELVEALMEIQDELLMYGITGVHEAGLNYTEFKLFDRLVSKGKLKLNTYAMLLPTEKNIAFAKKNGIYQNKNLLVRSFKVYGDGALGSRGAFLKHAYHDRPETQGYLTTSRDRMQRIFEICQVTGYQMNTHAIGDSTNRIVLDLYSEMFKLDPGHRWRIEHAQIVDPKDFHLFAEAGIIPSVQPTHATSDQKWAPQRLGEDHMEGAYAFNSILQQVGMIALGTDFPVEYVDPFRTIHAAVNRKDAENYPAQGFRPEEALSFDDCLRGMTYWAAFAAFQENELGSIEKGKNASITIFESPVKDSGTYEPNFAYMVFINGKKVYSAE